MPVTLAEARALAQTKPLVGVIDEFRRRSILLDALTYDDMSYPNASGHGWVYTYSRISQPSPAQVRAVNSEFTPGEAVTTPVNVELKILGGSFQVDRAIAETGYVVNHIAFQLDEKIKSAVTLAHDLIINGNSAVRPLEPDGLSAMLAGTTSEYGAGSVFDLSTDQTIESNYKAFLDALDDWLASLNTTPSAILGNTRMISRIRSAARRAGYMDRTLDGFGRNVERYNGIMLVDMGDKPDNSGPIIGSYNRTVGGTPYTGLTDLYAVTLGLNGFHGIAPRGRDGLVRLYLPNMALPGAVKTGEVEMITAFALRTTRAAGVFRNIKTQ